MSSSGIVQPRSSMSTALGKQRLAIYGFKLLCEEALVNNSGAPTVDVGVVSNFLHFRTLILSSFLLQYWLFRLYHKIKKWL